MTADHHPIATPTPDSHEWIPHAYSQLVSVGEHFDLVRIAGFRGDGIARLLVKAAAGAAGPIVQELYGREWVHFLTRPRTVREFHWPPGIQVWDGRRDFSVEIPALSGGSCLLRWLSKPTPDAPLVGTELLHTVLIRDPAGILDPVDRTGRATSGT
ncbi:hypothetical protein [Embleya sp. NPDC005971]|uniref:hypothetical protein n=1 Tax=unclassified Embleya TaxID=2699296 RepID=UPI0033DB7B2A